MFPSGLSLRLLLFYLVFALGNAQACVLMKDNKKVDIKETCKTVPCLIKCCPKSRIFFGNDTEEVSEVTCETTSYLEKTYNVSNLEDYSDLEIYNTDIKREIIKTEKNISSFIILYYEDFTLCNSELILDLLVPHVLENGRMEVLDGESLIKWPQSYEMGEFCFENTFDGTSRQIKFYRNDENILSGEWEKERRAVIVANCMMMSCVFTIMVLVVYSLLKELRNLAGLMLMAYVATYTVYSFLRIVHVYGYQYGIMDRKPCIVMTLLVYYTILSSFSWLNIMSFDIWWTLRATRKNLKTNRRGVLVKFGWYGLYGWGAPLLATAFVVAADHVDLPGIIKPLIFVGGRCFFGEDAHKYFVSCVIATMVSVNFVWFVLTAYNIWRVRRAITQYKEDIRETNKKNETRFLLYVKLSLLMGISKIFDAIPLDNWICYIIDGLNACSGLFIFILFVCKKKIILQLCVRLSINNKLVQKWSLRSASSTKYLTSTQSAKSEQPHGDKRSVETSGSHSTARIADSLLKNETNPLTAVV